MKKLKEAINNSKVEALDKNALGKHLDALEPVVKKSAADGVDMGTRVDVLNGIKNIKSFLRNLK